MGKIDFYTDVQVGDLDNSHEIYRVVVKDQKGKIVESIGSVSIENGFGQNRAEAYKDFIRRNSSGLLNKIFDVKKKE